MAKRARRTHKSRNPWRQRWPLIALTLIAVALLGVGLVYALSRDEPGEKIPDQGNAHIPEPGSYIWNSRPPTSGPHAPGLAPWGIHDETISPWQQVHNLEDGGVIIHYNCPEGCEEAVAELRAIVEAKGEDKLILQPNPDMDSRFAVTAWTRLLTLDEVDRDKIEAFIDAYRGIDHHR